MRKFAVLMLAVASIAPAAEIRFTWLPFSNNIPGAPQTQAEVTRYGINVYLESDNPAVTEFQISAVVKLSNGDVRIISGTATREGKADGVQYSTLCSLWVDTLPNFDVLAIEIKSVSSARSTKPTAGRPYTTEGAPSPN